MYAKYEETTGKCVILEGPNRFWDAITGTTTTEHYYMLTRLAEIVGPDEFQRITNEAMATPV